MKKAARHRKKARDALGWELAVGNCPHCGVSVLRITKGPLHGRLLNCWFNPIAESPDAAYMAGRHNMTECKAKVSKRTGNGNEYYEYHKKERHGVKV